MNWDSLTFTLAPAGVISAAALLIFGALSGLTRSTLRRSEALGGSLHDRDERAYQTLWLFSSILVWSVLNADVAIVMLYFVHTGWVVYPTLLLLATLEVLMVRRYRSRAHTPATTHDEQTA